MAVEVTRRLIIPLFADLRNRLLIGATRPLLPTVTASRGRLCSLLSAYPNCSSTFGPLYSSNHEQHHTTLWSHVRPFHNHRPSLPSILHCTLRRRRTFLSKLYYSTLYLGLQASRHC